MKKGKDLRKKITLLVLGISLALPTATAAWFFTFKNVINADISGNIVKEYFHTGVGTEDNPFVITRPIHYYHMVEFYQRESELDFDYNDNVFGLHFGTDYIYFQIGYQFDGQNYQVYSYDDAGKAITDSQGNPVYSDTLNMAYYSDQNALMPIGTSEIPFSGSFDGKGLTISNLNIVSQEQLYIQNQNVTRNTSDVGVFGYVGASATEPVNNQVVDTIIKDCYFDNVTLNLTNAGAIANCVAPDSHNIDDTNGFDTVYVGFLIGHLNYYNGAVVTAYTPTPTFDSLSEPVRDVYINNAKILGGTVSNLSTTTTFGLVGCIDIFEGGTSTSITGTIGEMQANHGDQGWGGSLDMKSMYENVEHFSSLGNLPAITTSEVVEMDGKTNTVISRTINGTSNTTANVTTGNTNSQIHHYYNIDEGRYYGFDRENGTSWKAYYIYGINTQLSHQRTTATSVTTITYDAFEQDGLYISYNGTYLTLNGSTLTTTTDVENTTAWLFSNENYLYWNNKDTGDNTYLTVNAQRQVVTSTTGSTVWHRDNNELYCTIGQNNYYLYYNGAWSVTRDKYLYQIGDVNGNYIIPNGNNAVLNSTNADNSHVWYMSNPTGTSTTFSIVQGNTEYYLSRNGTNVTLSTTATTWTKENNKYYITEDNVKYYLVCDNNTWVVRPASFNLITDGNNNYLSVNNTTIVNTTRANSVLWYSITNGSNVTLFTYINNNKYYLGFNGTNLTISQTSSSWTKSGNDYYVTSNGINFYLNFNSSTNAWEAAPNQYNLIKDDNNHYLNLNGTSINNNVTSSTNAAHWFFTGNITNGSGIFTIINGTRYFLNANYETLSLGTTQSTTWTRDNNAQTFYYTTNNIRYYLSFDSGWKTTRAYSYSYISDGTNYLNINDAHNGVTNGNSTNATKWIFSNQNGSTSSGTISTYINGTTYYLRYNNGLTVTTTSGSATSFTNTTYGSLGGRYLYNGSNFLYFNSSNSNWTMGPCYTYRFSFRGGEFITANAAMDGFTRNVTDESQATIWRFSTASTSATTVRPSGTIQIDGQTNKYLYSTTTNNAAITISNTSRSWTNNYDRLRVSRNRYFNTNYAVSDTNNVYFTFIPTTSVTISATLTIPTPQTNYEQINNTISTQLTTEQYNNPNFAIDTLTNNYPFTFTIGPRISVTTKVVDTTSNRTGYDTYLPLRINGEGDYKASDMNTGYIIGGGNFYDGSTSGTKVGDIRISRYQISGNISNAYDATNNEFTHVYTANASGNRIDIAGTEYSEIFTAASESLLETLNGETYVYGLHFMNTAIQTDHLAILEKAKILGKAYENYQMPEDSIDFTVASKGTISFFSGTYFTNNNAFFSLHEIFRDDDGKIISIKEIDEIYRSNENNEKDKYIYKFKDGTYTNADGTYTGVESLDSGYNRTAIFRTAWITNPTNFQTSSIYYFEIPVNRGEYALGSVEGKTGAYLIYLDIGANGNEGFGYNQQNDVADASLFTQVGYSTAEAGPMVNLPFNIVFTTPEGATANNFAVEVSYDGEYTYTINVVNTTGLSMDLSILLTDNDNDIYNEFPYNYKINYNGSEYTNGYGYESVEGVYITSATHNLPAVQ